MNVSLMALNVSRVGERVEIKTDALGERLRENRHERHDQKQARETASATRDQQPAHPGRLGRRTAASDAADGRESVEAGRHDSDRVRDGGCSTIAAR